MGGTESLTAGKLHPALINQGTVSSASDIYQASFALTCQCAGVGGRLAWHSLIKSECLEDPWRQRGRGSVGAGGDGEIRRGS